LQQKLVNYGPKKLYGTVPCKVQIKSVKSEQEMNVNLLLEKAFAVCRKNDVLVINNRRATRNSGASVI